MDQYLAICHKRSDSDEWERGDSARETGTFSIIKPHKELDEWTIASAFVVDKGTALCRHNFSNVEWHRNPAEFSRDQWQALACAAVIHPQFYLKNLLWREQCRHHLKAQNKDIITYEYNLYIRMFRLWYLWPVLLFLDLGLVVNALIRAIKNRNDPDDCGDDLNITSMIYVAKMVLPTPTSELARFLYKKLHPSIQRAWDHYYRHPENPPQNLIWQSTITKYFSK